MKQTLIKTDGSIVIELIDDCRECSFFDDYLDKCKFYDDDIFYNDETDKCEPCKKCRKDETEGGKMSEQEQIKGITRLLEKSYGICGNFSGCTNRKCSQCYAETLCNAGYRNADEVRKETAKEILKRGKYCMPSGLRDWIKEHYSLEEGE